MGEGCVGGTFGGESEFSRLGFARWKDEGLKMVVLLHKIMEKWK